MTASRICGDEAAIEYTTQTAVEKVHAAIIRLSSRNHFRNRYSRDHTRESMKTVQTICGTSKPARIAELVLSFWERGLLVEILYLDFQESIYLDLGRNRIRLVAMYADARVGSIQWVGEVEWCV